MRVSNVVNDKWLAWQAWFIIERAWSYLNMPCPQDHVVQVGYAHPQRFSISTAHKIALLATSVIANSSSESGMVSNKPCKNET